MVLQDDIQIAKLSNTEVISFSELLDVFANVFEMENFQKPETLYLQKLLEKPDFFVMVAKHQSRVVGGLTVYILDQYYFKDRLAYIYDVGMLPEFQRKGIGQKLIKELIAYCKETGISEAFVQADSEDEHAINFYRKCPFHSELEAHHFSFIV